MNVSAASDRIDTTLLNLERAIGEPVFDEWAIVQKSATSWKLIEYGGSRKAEFLVEFSNDIGALRDTLNPNNIVAGEFAFSHEGYGSGFDAHICAGTDLLVLFNNTRKSTGEITANPKWTTAQIYFSELLEAFIADPLVL
jgi:hypothetical protein